MAPHVVILNTVVGSDVFPSVKDLDFQDIDQIRYLWEIFMVPLGDADELMPKSFIVVAMVASHCGASLVSAFPFPLSCPSSPYQCLVHLPESCTAIMHCGT